MNKAMPFVFCALSLLCVDAAAYRLGKTSTGTSTGTSTTSSGSSTTGSCVGSYTVGKSAGSSGSTTSGCTTTPPAIDDDGDGMASTWEMTYGLDKYSDADKNTDPDNDYITNIVEYLRSLIPNNADTDGDGVIDGDDVAPGDAEQGLLTVDGLFKGSSARETQSTQ